MGGACGTNGGERRFSGILVRKSKRQIPRGKPRRR